MRNPNFIGRLMNMILLCWTVLLLGFVVTVFWQSKSSAERLAYNDARASIRKDIAYRKWAASHGGVYVPISEHTPANPYLSHLPNRDVITNDGQHLTLMNPAYILSQVTQDYAEYYGTKGHITSLQPLNPKNAPDLWEIKALNEMARTFTEYSELTDIDGEKFIRVLEPMVVIEGCLKCHAKQGYQVGDLRGGISASIPIASYYEDAFDKLAYVGTFFVVLWLIGVAAICHYKTRARKYLQEKQNDVEQYLFSLVDMIEGRDSYTAGHTKRVADYCVRIAKALDICEEQIEQLRRAAMLHDIGKIATPDSILLKPARLSKAEFSIIQQHATSGFQLLNRIDTFADIAGIVQAHHERYDGKGYPNGLKGDEIPQLAQIMAIADAFDAMTTDRIYKGRKSVQESLLEIERLAGEQFNPFYAEVAVKALSTVELSETNQAPKNTTERQRLAYFYNDQLTGLYNREYLRVQLAVEQGSSLQLGRENIQYAAAIYLKNFSNYNRAQGWESGDQLLVEISTQLSDRLTSALLFRLHGDDFLVLSPQALDFDTVKDILNRLTNNTCVRYEFEQFELSNEQCHSVESLEAYMDRQSATLS